MFENPKIRQTKRPNTFRQKPFRTGYFSFFVESSESHSVFNCLHDSNSIFRPGRFISETFFGRMVHMVCSQKICPKILRDHLAVQASSIDSPEQQRLTIEKFLQANVHGLGATPMDVDALAKTKGGKKGGKGADKKPETKKFDGTCFCTRPCGGGLPKEGSREAPNGPRAKAKEAKARRERRPSMNGQMDKRSNRLVRNQVRKLQVCSWVLLTHVESSGTDVKGTADVENTTDVTGKLGNGSRNRLNPYKAGNLGANS